MEVLHLTKYKCSTCGAVYDTEKGAQDCEARKVTHDRGVKIGDIVRITRGDGVGHTGTVERVYVLTKDWGHYAWEQYWHTVALEVRVNGSWGHRMLTFDDYATQQDTTHDQ